MQSKPRLTHLAQRGLSLEHFNLEAAQVSQLLRTRGPAAMLVDVGPADDDAVAVASWSPPVWGACGTGTGGGAVTGKCMAATLRDRDMLADREASMAYSSIGEYGRLISSNGTRGYQARSVRVDPEDLYNTIYNLEGPALRLRGRVQCVTYI